MSDKDLMYSDIKDAHVLTKIVERRARESELWDVHAAAAQAWQSPFTSPRLTKKSVLFLSAFSPGDSIKRLLIGIFSCLSLASNARSCINLGPSPSGLNA